MHRLHLLGRIDLRDVQGNELRGVLAQPKRLALLAYLAVRSRDGPCRRDTLHGVFWPELDQEHARKALNKAVHFLRQALGDAVLVSRSAEEVSVDAARVWCDVTAFEAAIEQKAFADALDIYRGELLPAFYLSGAAAFEQWLEQERSRLRRLAARAARSLAEQREGERQLTIAVAMARRAVELSDEDERTVRQLLELLDRLGDRAGALHAYEQFARRLATEYEAEPAAETKALVARIRARETAREGFTPAPNATPSDTAPVAPVHAGNGDALSGARLEPSGNRASGCAGQSLAAALRTRGYEVEQELGRGGMANVYLARDLRHERAVAIKVLHRDLADAVGTERFLSEVRLTANLAHPLVLPVLDSGVADDLPYYVMPFVSGGSLRDRLDREGQLPLEDALRVTYDVADALAHAHARDIIHRDVKPENILISGGHALVADFGIARAISRAAGERLTATGVMIGTPAYASPEQVVGGEVDGRADVYSLGCVLYEMLTGHAPYLGATPREVLARHALDPVPSLAAARPGLREELGRVVTKALAKVPADRHATAELFARALVSAATEPALADGGSRPARALRNPRRRLTPTRIAAAAGGLGVLVAASVASRIGLGGGTTEFVVGSTRPVTTAPGLEIHPAISPDGKMVAYVARSGRQFQVFVRPVEGGRAVMVSEPGEPSLRPQWSADGTRITYLTPSALTPSALYSVSALGGGRTLLLTETSRGSRGEVVLSPSGNRVAFAAPDERSIYVANADGTNAKKLATTSTAELHSLAWSPDEHIIAYVTGNNTFVSGGAIGNVAASVIWVVPASGGAPQRITDDTHLNTSPAWMPDARHVLFVSTLGGGRDIYSQRLGPLGEPRGRPRRLTTGSNAHTISVTADGSRVAYAALVTTSNIWTLPIPRRGAVRADSMRALTIGNQTIEHVSVSPDGKWLAFDSNVGGNADIYKMPVAGGEPLQLTRDPADDLAPVWSPDGGEIAFHSFRKGSRDVYVMRADGTDVQKVVATPAHEQRADWSADGSSLIYHGGDGGYVVRRSGGPGSAWGRPKRVRDGWVNSPATKAAGGGSHPAWSPVADSIALGTPRGLVIMSRDGEFARIVAPRIWATQASGGVDWSPDGRTLYYSVRDSSGSWGIWSVPVSGGVLRRIVHFADPARQLYRPRIDNDGRSSYFAIGSRESDIWVMDLAKK